MQANVMTISEEKLEKVEALRDNVEWTATGNWAKNKLADFEKARQKPEGWT